MTAQEFITWLHGYLEISEAKTINEKELIVIKDHLDTFFTKVTPDRSIAGDSEITTNPFTYSLKCTCLSIATNEWCPIHNPKNVQDTVIC